MNENRKLRDLLQALIWKLLKPGGKLAAILPRAILFRGDRFFSYFREHVLYPHSVEITPPEYYSDFPGIAREGHHPKVILLERGAFEGTEVQACIVCLEMK